MVENILENQPGQRYNMGILGFSKKGQVTLNNHTVVPHRSGVNGCCFPPSPGRMRIHLLLIAALAALAGNSVAAGTDSTSKINQINLGDSLSKVSAANTAASALPDSGLSTPAASADSLAAPQASAPQAQKSPQEDLVNILPKSKNIRAYGWGEYKVGGRCLCCDNLLDGDCIIIHSTNRTEKQKIKQIVDGKTEADTGDKSTYFGDVMEREQDVPVKVIMAEITLKKMVDLWQVTVYTMVDSAKKKSYLTNCELGYYDQFDRLQWAGNYENKENADHITFKMNKPVYTKSILIKVKGGTNRITEVGMFCKTGKE
jgi:hypothetical protein